MRLWASSSCLAILKDRLEHLKMFFVEDETLEVVPDLHFNHPWLSLLASQLPNPLLQAVNQHLIQHYLYAVSSRVLSSPTTQILDPLRSSKITSNASTDALQTVCRLSCTLRSECIRSVAGCTGIFWVGKCVVCAPARSSKRSPRRRLGEGLFRSAAG
jgi:hypothetical protein